MINPLIRIAVALLLTLLNTPHSQAVPLETAPASNIGPVSGKVELSVLEQFRAVAGQRAHDALLCLFLNDAADTVKQKPWTAQTHIEATLTNIRYTALDFASIEGRLIT